MWSSSCIRSVFFHCLPCSLCWGGGRTSKAVQGRDQNPHLVTGGGVMCWWYWCQRGKVFCCLSTIAHSHPLKQEFPKPFIQCNKRCKDFFLLLQGFHLRKTASPWVSILGGLIAEEHWQLSYGICQPPRTQFLQKPFGGEGCVSTWWFSWGCQCWQKQVYGMNWQPLAADISVSSVKASVNAEVTIELYCNTE